MDNFFDNKRILNSVWKWKIHIIIVLAITIVVSAIISSSIFITPKYKSVIQFYPENITEISEESTSEHLLQCLQSNDIKFRVIDAFNLDEVYQINPEDKYYQTYVLSEYDKNITYKKTEFEALKVKVLDEDPQRACNMCDSIVFFLNESVFENLAQGIRKKAYNNKILYEKKLTEVDSLTEMVDVIRKETGLVDYWAQAETATEGFMDAAARGGNKRYAEDVIEVLVENGSKLRRYQTLLDICEEKADTLQRRYEICMNFLNNPVSYTRVIEKPFPADKKAYPVRWLIVFLSTIAVALISIITVSLIDYIREIKSTL